MATVSLPPKPDPLTGEPRPPSAPSVSGPWTGLDRRHAGERSEHPDDGVEATRRSSNLDHSFESAHARRRHALRWAVGWSFFAVVVEGFLVGIYILFGDDPDLLGRSLWSRVLLLLVIGAGAWLLHGIVFYFAFRGESVSAGSTWAGGGSGSDDRVKIYELVTISVIRKSRSGFVLYLKDSKSAVLQLPMGLIEGNPRLWALVYNGIRHSTAAGAEVDSASRELLHLPPSSG